MGALPTQRVRMLATGDVVTINAQDFDETRYAVLSPEDLAASFVVPPATSAPAGPLAAVAAPEPPAAEDIPLRTDGPTLEEFVDAGYSQEVYPPSGYAAKESPGLEAYRALVASMTEVNAESAIAIVEAAETSLGLDRLEAAERAHPKHEGGRVSVIRAIGERRAALKE